MEKIDRKIVKKSNVFIEGRYRFGLHEQKILLMIISQVDDNQKEFTPYRVAWEDIKRASKGKINTVKKIDAACLKLKNKTISIKTGPVTDNFGFLSGWTTHQGEYVEFRIDPGMKDMLLGLMKNGNFTMYDLEFALALSSAHAIRIYEIVKSLAWKNQPVTIKVADLKAALDIPDDSKAYVDFGLFRRNILDTATKSINDKTDLRVSYRAKKVGRRVDSLEFTIKTTRQQASIPQPGQGKKRNFVRPGDTVIIDGQEYQVSSTACMLPDRAIPIGDLTRMLQAGEISLK